LVDDGYVNSFGQKSAALIFEGVMRYSRHGHPGFEILAGVLGRERDVTSRGEDKRIFKESLEKVTDPVQHNIFRQRPLCLHKVRHHGGK
jgi:hypothetical protein